MSNRVKILIHAPYEAEDDLIQKVSQFEIRPGHSISVLNLSNIADIGHYFELNLYAVQFRSIHLKNFMEHMKSLSWEQQELVCLYIWDEANNDNTPQIYHDAGRTLVLDSIK